MAARHGPRREPHAGDVVDTLGSRLERELEVDPFQRDPGFLRRHLDTIEAGNRYFSPEVRGLERLPAETPYLLVGNHSGGLYTPDAYSLMLAVVRHLGVEQPVYFLAFDLLFALPGLAGVLRKIGAVPASPRNAERALDEGAPVLVYPGGDHEAFRPWWQRARVDFGGRKGFVRLALRKGVPIVPVVSHGSHETTFVVARGDRIARALRLDRLRVSIFPFVLGLPWGLAPGFLPSMPFPARVTVQICEPLRWPGRGPETADDEAVVAACAAEVVGAMQAELDRLYAELPDPWLGRLGLGRPGLGRPWLGRLRRRPR